LKKSRPTTGASAGRPSLSAENRSENRRPLYP
jgi:hypothetical protein